MSPTILKKFTNFNFPTFFLAGYPVVNDPLYNHEVFGPQKGKGGLIGKSDEQLIQDLISIHNAENWLGKYLQCCQLIRFLQVHTFLLYVKSTLAHLSNSWLYKFLQYCKLKLKKEMKIFPQLIFYVK